LTIDPNASIGRLVEAFEEVLDLGIPNRLGRLVDVHHHAPLEVRHGAGYCVQLEGLTSPGSGGRDNGSLARLFWRVLDALDYWEMQAKQSMVDAVYGPEPETEADRRRACDRVDLSRRLGLD
jgi:hypothetical protein